MMFPVFLQAVPAMVKFPAIELAKNVSQCGSGFSVVTTVQPGLSPTNTPIANIATTWRGRASHPSDAWVNIVPGQIQPSGDPSTSCNGGVIPPVPAVPASVIVLW